MTPLSAQVMRTDKEALRVFLLLSGYDKAGDPSGRRQRREIARARKLLRAWGDSQKRVSGQVTRADQQSAE